MFQEMCKALGVAVYPASLFTKAPVADLSAAIAAAELDIRASEVGA
jgi:hypothetical protein